MEPIGRSSSPALLVFDELALPGPNDARASSTADSLTGDGAAADGTERRRSRATASSVGESSVPGEKNCAGGRAGDRPLLALELVLDEFVAAEGVARSRFPHAPHWLAGPNLLEALARVTWQSPGEHIGSPHARTQRRVAAAVRGRPGRALHVCGGGGPTASASSAARHVDKTIRVWLLNGSIPTAPSRAPSSCTAASPCPTPSLALPDNQHALSGS